MAGVLKNRGDFACNMSSYYLMGLSKNIIENYHGCIIFLIFYYIIM